MTNPTRRIANPRPEDVQKVTRILNQQIEMALDELDHSADYAFDRLESYLYLDLLDAWKEFFSKNPLAPENGVALARTDASDPPTGWCDEPAIDAEGPTQDGWHD